MLQMFNFNHKTRGCKFSGSTKCSDCTDLHHYKECKTYVKKCMNCIDSDSNLKYKTQHDIHHGVLDQNCPLLQQQIKKVQDRTDYNLLNFMKRDG